MTPVYWLDGRRRGNKAFSPVVRHGNPARSVVSRFPDRISDFRLNYSTIHSRMPLTRLL